ncbi:MAG: TRAP transporter substrate-binding protein [Chloroflexi bacterium]|nr:TRAP transporter substrate-binding protein [Chloroflexota bacterium]
MSTTDGHPIRLRFAGYSPPTTTHSQAAARFKELLERRTRGAIEVDLFWNVLDFGYTGGTMVQMVDSGFLNGMYMSTSYFAGECPKLAALDLPFLFDTRERAFAALDGEIGLEMAADLGAHTGLAVVGYWENGFRHLSNRLRPIRQPEDIRGLRVRIQPSPLYAEAFRAIGAEPVATDILDLIPALAEGRVDGQENPLDNTWTYGAYRYTPYVTLTAQFFGVRVMCLNRRWLESLPDSLQAAVRETALEASRYQRQLAAQRDAAVSELLTSSGVQIDPLPADTLAAFRAASEPVYAGMRERVGEAFVEALTRS